MAILGRELLKIADAKVQRVPVPEWATPENPEPEVCVRVMTGLERDRFEFSVYGNESDEEGRENYRAKFCAAVICDEQGNNLFGPMDVQALGQKSSTALQRILDRGLEVNAMSKPAADDLEKNSEGTRSGAASSASA